MIEPLECISWLEGQCIKSLPVSVLLGEARTDLDNWIVMGLFAFGALISFIIAAYAMEDKPKVDDDEKEDEIWRAIK
jgi:hypothetical protein